jgi:hypothetical protein
METLTLVIGYLLCGLVGLLGLAVLWNIYNGTIDLSQLISETNGDASMSRFQFLVFTFVISLSLFLVIVAGKCDGKDCSVNKPAFPDSIPAGILTLLGISGSTYAVGKAISYSDPAGVEKQELSVKISPVNPTVKYGKTLQFSAEVSRDIDAKLSWEVIAGSGTIDDTGLFKAPDAPSVPPALHATVKVSLMGYSDVSDLAVVTFVS